MGYYLKLWRYRGIEQAIASPKISKLKYMNRIVKALIQKLSSLHAPNNNGIPHDKIEITELDNRSLR